MLERFAPRRARDLPRVPRSRPPARPRLRSLARFAFVALAALIAVVLAPARAHAQSRRSERREARLDESSLRAPAIRVPYVVRPITTTRGHLSLYFGLGGEYVDYYRNYAAPLARPAAGLGAHLDVSVGITDWLELAVGAGVRWTEDPRDLADVNPDRYARVNREWLPTQLELAREPYTAGHEYVTNPYLRARFALLNRRPVFVGVDLYALAPIAPRSCFTTDVGVPVHITAGNVVRIETGVFHEFLFCEVAPMQGLATQFWSFQIPLRVLFQLTPGFWLGLRTGIESLGYRFDSGYFTVPLGIQGGVRLVPRVDLLFHVLAPEFVHFDPSYPGGGRNVWLDRIGAGVAVQIWLL